MRKHIAILILTLLALASCSIDGPLYHEVLMPPIADGTWITYQGIGNSRTMLILTVEDNALSLAMHAKDPFTGDFSTEPFATYTGYAEDIRTLSEDISYSWYRTYHRMRITFTDYTGSGRYTPGDLSGYVDVIYSIGSSQDSSPSDSSIEVVPVHGTEMRLRDASVYYVSSEPYDEPSALSSYTWTLQ